MLGALILGGCGRRDDPSPAAAAASASASLPPSSPPVAAASSAPASAPPSFFTFSLEAAAGVGTKTDVSLISVELDLREKIASVPPDVGCVLGALADGWAVWCADAFPHPVATLRRVDGGLTLVRLGAPSRTLPLPAGANVAIGAAEASIRSLPGKACEDSVKPRPLKAIVSTRSSMGEDFGTGKIAVVEGGRTLAWPLPQVKANVICRVGDPLDGLSTLVCAKEPICTFKGTPGRLEIACGEARTLVLPRCGSVPTLEVGTISRSRSYE